MKHSRIRREIMMDRSLLGLTLLGMLVVSGCDRRVSTIRPASQEDSRDDSSGCLMFADGTEAAGLHFTYQSGSVQSYAPILHEMGGGCGIADLDRDGWPDLVLTGGGSMSASGPNPGQDAFFRNRGDGTFENASRNSGLASLRYSHGVAIADYDADGFADVLITGWGGLQLYHNQGDGSFQEQAGSAGLSDELWSTSAAWGDVNGDGDLDLYICHYVDWHYAENDPVWPGPEPDRPESCPPRQFGGLPDRLFCSRGDGRFRDVSTASGLRSDGKGLGVVLADLDGDLDVEISVANDSDANFLYRNEGTRDDGIPILTEIGVESGTAMNDRGAPDGSMGMAILDFNRDARPDLWVSNYEFESPGLYRNEGQLTFTHASRAAGIALPQQSFVSFGTAAADFDGDGDEDVLVTNGHVLRYPQNGAPRQRCQLFENLGNGGFRDVSSKSGLCLNIATRGRGLAVADVDRDGDPDGVLCASDEPARLLLNRQARSSQWMAVELVGFRSPRDGTGARIDLFSSVESRRGTRWVYSGESYLSSSERRVCLADAPALTELRVYWPSGQQQSVSRIGDRDWIADRGRIRIVDRVLVVIEPE